VKELLPPYIGEDLELGDLRTGVVFASGGSGYDPLTSILTVTKYCTCISQYRFHGIYIVFSHETIRLLREFMNTNLLPYRLLHRVPDSLSYSMTTRRG
jgi:hypothetical protein